MLLTLMFLCAAIAILLIAFGTFDELRDVWAHPDHRPAEHDPHVGKPRR